MLLLLNKKEIRWDVVSVITRGLHEEMTNSQTGSASHGSTILTICWNTKGRTGETYWGRRQRHESMCHQR